MVVVYAFSLWVQVSAKCVAVWGVKALCKNALRGVWKPVKYFPCMRNFVPGRVRVPGYWLRKSAPWQKLLLAWAKDHQLVADSLCLKDAAGQDIQLDESTPSDAAAPASPVRVSVTLRDLAALNSCCPQKFFQVEFDTLANRHATNLTGRVGSTSWDAAATSIFRIVFDILWLSFVILNSVALKAPPVIPGEGATPEAAKSWEAAANNQLGEPGGAVPDGTQRVRVTAWRSDIESVSWLSLESER